jgi:hypothetical protein
VCQSFLSDVNVPSKKCHELPTDCGLLAIES